MFKKNWIAIPLFIIGFYYCFWTIQKADQEDIFQGLIFSSLFLLLLIFFIISIFKDVKKFRIEKKILNFAPTVLGIFILSIIIIINIILSFRDFSPVLIQAGYDGGYNGASFDFREDGTYKFVNSSGLGTDTFRGRYTIEDSIIILDKSNLEFLKTNKLAIRHLNYPNSENEKVVCQIDENHNIIDKDFYFRVNEYRVLEK